LNVVLSYGDLSGQGGYRTRVLGELQTLDRQAGMDPFLLVFDRRPSDLEKSFSVDVPYRVLNRSAFMRFYPAISNLARRAPIHIVHAHNLYSAALALSARPIYGYKVVLDYHGRIPEEYVFLGKGGGLSRQILEGLERWAVRKSDHVVAVSQRLAKYLIDCHQVDSKKVTVIPCCADETVFTVDVHRREALRRSMNLSNKLVCTHLGSFFEWYDPELIVRTFHNIRSSHDSHLLVVTFAVNEVVKYLSARLPGDSFSVIQVAHDQVPQLLNASDLGFLLLRSSPNIKTSSPVKFSEYLNCGLPVLITSEVGDYSEMVAQEGIGSIVSEGGAFDATFIDSLAANREHLARRCAAVGQRLTWQAFYPAWSALVGSLNDGANG
jgi:glycosyltransferase involved in cell wall biosynthesis